MGIIGFKGLCRGIASMMETRMEKKMDNLLWGNLAGYRDYISYFESAGKEGMEKSMEATMKDYVGTTVRINSVIPC